VCNESVGHTASVLWAGYVVSWGQRLIPGICTGALSLRACGSNRVISGATRDPGGSDLGQLPYCYMRPSAKLVVKPINWSLRSNLNGAPRYQPTTLGVAQWHNTSDILESRRW
jgi:hypothetical protein